MKFNLKDHHSLTANDTLLYKRNSRPKVRIFRPKIFISCPFLIPGSRTIAQTAANETASAQHNRLESPDWREE